MYLVNNTQYERRKFSYSVHTIQTLLSPIFQQVVSKTKQPKGKMRLIFRSCFSRAIKECEFGFLSMLGTTKDDKFKFTIYFPWYK